MISFAHSIKSSNVKVCTPEMFWSHTRARYVADICAQIRDAWEALKRGALQKEEFDTIKGNLKKRLPVIIPHATFRYGKRLNKDAVPTGLVMLDVDHIPAPRELYEARIRGREQEMGICLVHITPSTEGLRVISLPKPLQWEGSLPQAQERMAKMLGVELDKACKDLARSSFLVPEDYILYIDEQTLFGEASVKNGEENLTTTMENGEKNLTTTMENGEGNLTTTMENGEENLTTTMENGEENLTTTNENEQNENTNKSSGLLAEGEPREAERISAADINAAMGAASAPSFKGSPYADIIARWWTLTGGEPQQGERNDKLHRLACELRYICDDDAELMLRIMPRYGLDESEMAALIKSALTKERRTMSKVLRQAVHDSDNSSPSLGGGEGPRQAEPPLFPSRLPRLIALLTSCTPEVYKPAVATAVFPSLGIHLHRTEFRYLDNKPHEATFMNVLMAGTGAGKDCISDPISYIMADVRERDAHNLMREKEWKEQNNRKGANKDKLKRPEGLVIQEVDPDMTNPALVMRMAEADDHFLYVKVNEIEQFDALGANKYTTMCLSFDYNNRYGQTRVGAQSVTEKVKMRLNFNASTTIIKGRQYFQKVLTDGPVSRINFCTIPAREIGSEMPLYGIYPRDFSERLKPYLDNLMAASGEICCPEADTLARQLMREASDWATLTQNATYENLSFRALVIAWLKACVLYVANGQKWEAEIEEFVRWSFHYDMWCKMEFFGDDIDKANAAAARSGKRGPQNLLDFLPEVFTLSQVESLRAQHGLESGSTKGMLGVWRHRGYIDYADEGGYKKVEGKK